MNTPSHLLMTAFAGKWYKLQNKGALLLGAVAPDIPLYLLSLFGLLYFRAVGMTSRQAFEHIYGTLYFQDVWWISLHNLLHTPIPLLSGMLIFFLLRKKYPRLSSWMLYFFAAALVHSFVDILTHFDDGPLLLFPFNLELRFASPISYWDPAHYGREFSIFEGILNIAFILYLLPRTWWAKMNPFKKSA
jgi:membrane-bound metal-dependent hydrolase YbcI (DUF457 family)